MNDLKVTIVQSLLHWENIDLNLEMFSKKLALLNEPCDLIILPEMFNTGFTMRSKELAEPPGGKTMQWMAQQAKEKKSVIAGSLIVKENNDYFNRLIWMLPDGSYKVYDKRHLFRMAGEHENFSAGQQRIIVNLKGWNICPLVCYDLRFPVWSRNKNQSKNRISDEPEYDCLIYLANWPERRSYAWKTLLQARAIENQCYLIGVNRIGIDGKDILYSGDSAVIDPKGTIISTTKPHEESMETVSLSYQDLMDFRKAFPVGLDGDDFEMK